MMMIEKDGQVDDETSRCCSAPSDYEKFGDRDKI